MLHRYVNIFVRLEDILYIIIMTYNIPIIYHNIGI